VRVNLLLIFLRWVSVPVAFAWVLYTGYDTDCTEVAPVAVFFLSLLASFVCWGVEAVRCNEVPEEPGVGLTGLS